MATDVAGAASDAAVLAAWALAFPGGPCGALLVPVTLCGLPEAIALPAAALASLYLPLCRRLARAAAAAAPRLLVGVSGPAGSGKTCLAAVLTALLNAGPPAAFPTAALVSMDAYHMPNAWLAEHGLAPFKGRSDTYHTAALAADLALLRAPTATPPQPPAHAPPPLPARASWASAAPSPCGAGLQVLLPVYDRGGTHDPRLGGAAIAPAVALVLVEGLFVGRAGGPWGAVRSQLGEVIALRVPLALCRARALHRRLRSILLKQGASADAGSGRAAAAPLDAAVLAQLAAAQAHYARADAPTYAEVAADEAGASIVLAHALQAGGEAALGGSGEAALALPAAEAIAALQRLGSSSGGLGELVALRGL